MAHFVNLEKLSGDQCVHHYSNIERNDLIAQLDSKFASWGYKVESGSPGNASYEKGNRVMRILFGAFVKYFKFTVVVSENNDGIIKVGVQKTTSGMSGRLIGLKQVSDELIRVAEELKKI